MRRGRLQRYAHKLSSQFDTDFYLVMELLELLDPENVEKILEMSPSDINPTARVNRLLTSRDVVINRLLDEGIQAKPIEGIPEGIEITAGWSKIGFSQTYLNGEVMPQGLGSLLSIVALDPQPGEIILDMAAAPGGKSCFIGERMSNQGILISNDVSKKRLRSLQFNLARHSIQNVIVSNQDGRKLNYQDLDRVLLDAPCTGAGLLVSKQERRSSKSFDDYIHLQQLQIQLVQSAIKCLKVSGILIYATCSFSPMENEEVLSNFLNSMTIQPLDMKYSPGLSTIDPDFEHATRLYPHTDKCDGFFIAKLMKEG